MLQDLANMRLEQCAFQIWSWSIFDLENYFRLLMVQGPYGPGAKVEAKISKKRSERHANESQIPATARILQNR